MMMMRMFFGLLFFVSSSLIASAQVKPIYFYGDQVTTDKDKATSYAVYGKLSNEELWTFKRFDLYDNLLQTGSYADESLTVAHGKFVFYSDLERFNLIYNTTFKLKGKTRFISQEGTFINGLEQGKWLLFYPDGNIFSAQNFVDGKMDGTFTTYDRYGVVLITGNYIDGEKHGEWLLEKGTIRETYNMGVLKSKEFVKKIKNAKGAITQVNKNN